MVSNKKDGEIIANKLAVVLEAQGISADRQNELAKAFGGPFDEVGAILADYSNDPETGALIPGEKAVKVTDETQIKEITLARKQRLALKSARNTIEKKRVELKAESLKAGRAIDAVAKFVTLQIEPIEKHLETQEKFAELKRKKEEAERLASRTEAIAPYADPAMYTLATLSDEQFDNLLADLKEAERKRIEDEKEAQRLKDEEAKAEKARQKALEDENKRLREEAAKQKEADDRKIARVNQVTSLNMKWNEETRAYESHDQFIAAQDILEMEPDEWNSHFSEVSKILGEYREKEEAERKAAEEAKEKELQDQKAKADLERKKREAAEDAQRKRQAELDKKAAEVKEARRQALLAPDKDKLLAYADSIDALVAPRLETHEAGALIDETIKKLESVCNDLREKAAEL